LLQPPISTSPVSSTSNVRRAITRQSVEKAIACAASRWRHLPRRTAQLNALVSTSSSNNSLHFQNQKHCLSIYSVFGSTTLGFTQPLLWSGGQSSVVRFPALPDFFIISGSGTGSTQPREYNWGATWKKNYRLRSRNPRLRPCWLRDALYTQKVLVFNKKWVPEVLSWDKARPTGKADNLSAICEPII
jgi:hypothetical protein